MIAVLLGFEATLWAVLTPILPHYARTLGASKPAIGVLTGAYGAGLIPGAFLSAWLAARAGVRRTTLAGMLTFAVTVVPFGFATNIVVLDVLRALQGVGSGFIWGGGLTWLIAANPQGRRGAVLGSAFSAAIAGSLAGPAVGTLAVAVGTEITFAAVGALALALAVWARSYPEPSSLPSATRVRVGDIIRNRAVLLGTWLIFLEAIASGIAYTLIPLRLARFGASTFAIGAIFFLISALSGASSMYAGRLSDRWGAIPLIGVGLVLGIVMTAMLPVGHSAAVLAAIAVPALAGPFTIIVIPASALLTVAVELAGITLIVATLLVNLAFALGQTLSAPTGAALAQATSDAVPFAIVSALMLATACLVLAWRRQPEVAEAAAATGHLSEDAGEEPVCAPGATPAFDSPEAEAANRVGDQADRSPLQPPISDRSDPAVLERMNGR
jgi:predicted MFS family arabinose efflux permease